MNRTALAKVIGCHKSMISNILAGKIDCPPGILAGMLEALGMEREGLVRELEKGRKGYLEERIGRLRGGKAAGGKAAGGKAAGEKGRGKRGK